MIPINRISLTREMKVLRTWKEQQDTSLMWRKRVDSIWLIEQHNEPPPSRKPMYSLQGSQFRASDHSVTLDDFVFLQDKGVYVHLGTNQHFTARHINKLIFKDRSTWPHNLLHGRIKPTSFMRRYNRVTQSAELSDKLNALTHIRGIGNAQQAA